MQNIIRSAMQQKKRKVGEGEAEETPSAPIGSQASAASGSSSNIDALQESIAKLALQNSQQLRQLRGAVLVSIFWTSTRRQQSRRTSAAQSGWHRHCFEV